MGMFDYVYYECPECHEIVEEQSKAADCSLNRYIIGDIAYKVLDKYQNAWNQEYEQGIQIAPLEILAEAQRYGLECPCGCKVKANLVQSLILTPWED